jgi:hypothetical protein
MDPLEQQFRAAVDQGDEAEILRLGALVDAQDEATRQRLAQPGALLAAALYYMARGWPVFPCVVGGKVPATENGLHDASLDEDQIRAWWTRNPDYNIGLPTGHAFDVIDIDYDPTKGIDGWRSLITHRELKLPPRIGSVLTPRRPGAHRYVAATGRGNKTGLLPGIDYRGKGGYVVAPPSRTTDGTYMWATPVTT